MTERSFTLGRKETDIAKGVAILLMVAHHCFAFPGRQPTDLRLEHIIVWGQDLDLLLGMFGKVCVGMFFVISGYALGLKTPSLLQLPGQLVKRIGAFFATFWINCAILLPAAAYWASSNPTFARMFNWSQATLLKNLFMVEPSYSLEWWFGRPYLLMILVVWPVFLLLRRLSPLAPVLLSVALYGAALRLSMPWLVEVLHWQSVFAVGFLASAFDVPGMLTKAWGRCPAWAELPLLALMLVGCVLLRWRLGILGDVVLAPLLVVVSIHVVRRYLAWLPLARVGALSAHMWFNHTFFFYYCFPRFFYGLGNHALVYGAVLLCSLALAFVTDGLQRLLTRGACALWERVYGESAPAASPATPTLVPQSPELAESSVPRPPLS